MHKRVVVVGGGASGMMAAGRAAEMGAQVVLLEKMSREGSKLRITGKGRCNVTNDCDVQAFLTHLQPNGNFMRNAFARFFVPELLTFFQQHGVPTVTERGRRVFPASNRAADVVAALRRYGDEHGVNYRFREAVAEILVADGKACGVRLRDGNDIAADSVVLATGGLSYPATGSTGDGYTMARALGHTIVPLRPGLVPLVTAENDVPRMQGLSLRNVRATVYSGEKALASEFGELLFTHFGVSGPIILTLSSQVGDALQAGPLRLSIDLKPALDETQLDARLQRDLARQGKANYRRLLRGLLPRLMVDVFMERSGVAADQRLSQFTAEQRGHVVHLLKHFDLTLLRARPIDEAIITRGGVLCKEIDPATMASRLVDGLYFAGEIIDVAGDTGGYNLQVAFTTGYLAGEAAVQQV